MEVFGLHIQLDVTLKDCSMLWHKAPKVLCNERIHAARSQANNATVGPLCNTNHPFSIFSVPRDREIGSSREPRRDSSGDELGRCHSTRLESSVPLGQYRLETMFPNLTVFSLMQFSQRNSSGMSPAAWRFWLDRGAWTP